MRVATIDIGTNTVLLLVAERGASGDLVAVREEATITRLGQGVDRTRQLAPEAIARTTTCLDRYAELVAEARAERVAVVGTSAMRDAGGGDEVRSHVKARFGVEARTISGEEEARLTFAGALSGLPARQGEAPAIVFDIGGGSTEVVRGAPSTGAISFSRSYDVGSVRLTERLVKEDPPTPGEKRAILETAAQAFASVPVHPDDALIPPVGIAGTMTTLAAVSMKLTAYDPTRVHGATLSIVELDRVIDELGSLPLDARKALPGLEPKRADVIVAGALVARALLARLGARAVTISDRGVRWGLAASLL